MLPAVFSCLFVRLIISDFLLSLLVFLRSPPHISFSQRQRLPSAQSGKAKHRCRRFALYPRLFSSDWGHRSRSACPASSLVEPDPLRALIGRIRLRRVERRRSRRCLARAAKLPLLPSCLSLLTFTQATGPSVDIRRRLLRLLHKYLIGRGANI